MFGFEFPPPLSAQLRHSVVGFSFAWFVIHLHAALQGVLPVLADADTAGEREYRIRCSCGKDGRDVTEL